MLELTNIRVGLVDGIATVTISRPQAMNALNPLTISELAQVVDWIEGDNGVRAVIITGDGPKAFVAGADIAAMRHMTAEQAETFSKAAWAWSIWGWYCGFRDNCGRYSTTSETRTAAHADISPLDPTNPPARAPCPVAPRRPR